MAQVPEVLVLGIVGFAADFEGDVVLFGIVDFLLTALDAPFAPRGDDGQLRREGLDGQFEAHLVVALAGAAMADGVRALLFGDLHDALGDDGPREAGAQQVFTLIYSARLHGGIDVVGDEFLFQVLDVELARAGFEGLFLQPLQLRALAHVAGDGDDLAVVIVLLEPGDDDGGVQPAGICEHNFLNILLGLGCHSKCLLE